MSLNFTQGLDWKGTSRYPVPAPCHRQGHLSPMQTLLKTILFYSPAQCKASLCTINQLCALGWSSHDSQFAHPRWHCPCTHGLAQGWVCSANKHQTAPKPSSGAVLQISSACQSSNSEASHSAKAGQGQARV